MQQDDVNPARQQEAREDRDKLNAAEASREAEDIFWLMSERTGRRIAYGLLAETGVYTGSYTGDAETFFREGKRAVGLKYLSIMNAKCPEQYVMMLREHQEDAG